MIAGRCEGNFSTNYSSQLCYSNGTGTLQDFVTSLNDEWAAILAIHGLNDIMPYCEIFEKNLRFFMRNCMQWRIYMVNFGCAPCTSRLNFLHFHAVFGKIWKSWIRCWYGEVRSNFVIQYLHSALSVSARHRLLFSLLSGPRNVLSSVVSSLTLLASSAASTCHLVYFLKTPFVVHFCTPEILLHSYVFLVSDVQVLVCLNVSCSIYAF